MLQSESTEGERAIKYQRTSQICVVFYNNNNGVLVDKEVTRGSDTVYNVSLFYVSIKVLCCFGVKQFIFLYIGLGKHTLSHKLRPTPMWYTNNRLHTLRSDTEYTDFTV